jgi:hypothetical protein
LNLDVGRGGQPVFFLDEELDDLPLAGGQIPDFLPFFSERFRVSGVHEQSEAGDDAGIDPVGFGELIRGSGEVPDLSGIDHGHGNSMPVQLGKEGSFESSGGFEADEADWGFPEGFEETFESCEGVGDGLDVGLV